MIITHWLRSCSSVAIITIELCRPIPRLFHHILNLFHVLLCPFHVYTIVPWGLIVTSICSIPRSVIFTCSVPLDHSALIAFCVPCIPRFIDHPYFPMTVFLVITIFMTIPACINWCIYDWAATFNAVTIRCDGIYSFYIFYLQTFSLMLTITIIDMWRINSSSATGDFSRQKFFTTERHGWL